MTDMPHQIITKALGAEVHVAVIRETSDGTVRHAVAYESGSRRWLSRHRFPDHEQAQAGALTLADVLGAEYRA
jgi:hypothetical protein